MARDLTYERIATTEDTGEPVIHAELSDTGSYVNAVISGDREVIRVTHVESFHKGDMALMLDSMTRQLATQDVRFMVPLGEAVGSDLAAKLDGFEQTTEVVQDPDGGTMEVEVLVGEWDYTRRADS